MRLTLRTLLAWLDDTLTPAEVRAIGKQVAESEFAKELVERIHKVTRQRRLTVPPRIGAEAVDPNIISSYLDNELEAEEVAELEKRCLTSDVHLAEVASVHQVLSLIGQKAKVPIEARERMYRLVKGRESITTPPPVVSARRPPVPELVSSTIKPWVRPVPPPRRFSQQFGPIAAIMGLIGILCWSAWVSLGPDERVANQPSNRVPLAGHPGDPKHGAVKDEALVEAPNIVAAMIDPAKTKVEEVKPVDQLPVKVERKFPEGVVAEAEAPTGLLLRFNATSREWDRLVEKTPLKENDRLLTLQPFQAVLDTSASKITMSGETEIKVLENDSASAAKFQIALGKVRIQGTTPPLPFEVVVGSNTLTIEPASGQIVGVERVTRREMGKAVSDTPSAKIWLSEGTVKVRTAERTEAILTGPGSIQLESGDRWSEIVKGTPPDWVLETPKVSEPDATADKFLKMFRSERPLVSSLVEASEDEDPEICRLAIPALRAVGDISYVVPILNSHGSKSSGAARRSAIETLRSVLAEGPEPVQQLKTQLSTDLGDDIAAATETLLIGYQKDSPEARAAIEKLILVLGTSDDTDIGLRELALVNLMTITGKPDMGYQADKPEGQGLKNWEALRDEQPSRNEDMKEANSKRPDSVSKKAEVVPKKPDSEKTEMDPSPKKSNR